MDKNSDGNCWNNVLIGGTMEANKTHRQALLNNFKIHLEEKESLEFQKRDREEKDSSNEISDSWTEVRMFLNGKMIEIITEAIENNELDNF